MSVMGRANARRDYVAERVGHAVDRARGCLQVGGKPEVALGILVEAVDAAAALGFDEPADSVNEMLRVYEAADDRGIAILNAVNWGVPVDTVLRAAGLNGTRRL